MSSTHTDHWLRRGPRIGAVLFGQLARKGIPLGPACREAARLSTATPVLKASDAMVRTVIGIDVGTASVRAGVFSSAGRMLAACAEPIDIFRPQANFAEQSSENIWEATGKAVRGAMRDAAVEAASVAGISYDATCSLVALDAFDRPITVSPSADVRWNIVMWMDHRAIDIAEQINATDHAVLRYVGGRISPEMEPPKLKWIKENLPDTWRGAGKFFDLADFMAYQSCGNDVRSLCTLVCKWAYLGHEGEYGSWRRDFYQQIGLDDLFDGTKVTDVVRPMGATAGGLTTDAAQHLGLLEGTPVGVGIIDAHAGGLGVLGAVWEDEGDIALEKLETAVAYIGGTSACIMAVSREAIFVDGVWGPYYSAMVPGMWLTEGGQSAAGGLIDYVLENNAQGLALTEQAAATDKSVYEILNDIVQRETHKHGPAWTKDLHIVGNHHGNRSPHADPLSKGIVDGLTLDTSIDAVAKRYYATVQALACSTREVIEVLNSNGYRIDKIFACGGGTKNPVWLQEHANICDCSIVLPRESEAVLLGVSMIAAVGGGIYPDIPTAMQGMGHAGETVLPQTSYADYYQTKYEIFKQMYWQHVDRRAKMAAF